MVEVEVYCDRNEKDASKNMAVQLTSDEEKQMAKDQKT